MAGEWFIENPDATAHFSLRVPSSQRTVTVQGGVAMPVNAVRRLGNFIIEQLEDCDTYPRIMSSGGITVDLFLEHDPTREIQGSAEANLDELTVTITDGEIELTLDDIIAAGFYRDSRFNLEGGGDVLVPKSSQLDVEPFGIHFSLRESQMIGLESEIFDWSFSGINGRCALLGGANIAEFPRPGWANIEVSFARLGYDLISADPFSLLVSHGDAGYSFQASPIGLHRSGTIWLEEVSGNAGADLADVTAGFSWYGLVGEALGSVAWMQQRQAGGMLYRLNLLDTMGAPAFEVKVVDSDDDYEIQASGALNYAWINTLLNWVDAGRFSLGGDEPLLANANLGFKDSLLSGSFDLQMDGLDVRLDSGVQIEGVNGKVDGAVMLLPRSLGKQVTRIDRISSGPVTMENILVEWELKSLRELIIYKFVAGIGDGVIELEPFSFNPLRPVFNTAVVVRKFDADLLRQWLSEKRFAIDAFIAGRIPIGWKDGQLLLGTGIFTMDTE